ncbi:MAG: hypothetical protein J7501_06845 [Bdellovibrio sp.]|nr:hypothetical protein [Bdellovibrio sp.]
MGPIKFKTWLTWALVLFVLGLLADYYFLHMLFHEKQAVLNGTAGMTEVPSPTPLSETADPNSTDNSGTEPDVDTPNRDNFNESLQKCAPEIAAQAVATPEALMEYLKKSVGVKQEQINIENYHLALADGSQRRVQLISADNTNSANKKELRFFKLDAQGYPERLALKGTETVESLLAMGKVQRTERKSELTLKDGSQVTLETHDNKVYEFQFNNHGKILSCRLKECQCP